jgi:hypothetical protein
MGPSPQRNRACPISDFQVSKSAIADLVGSALCAEHLRVTEHAFADAYCAGAVVTGGLVGFFAAAGALACAVVFSSGGGLAASADGDVGVHGPAPAVGFFVVVLVSVGFAVGLASVGLVSVGLLSVGLATAGFLLAGGSGAA